MNKEGVFIVVVAVVVVLGGWYYYSSNTAAPSTSVAITDTTNTNPTTPTQQPMTDQNQAATAPSTDIAQASQATLHTSMGDITVKFYKNDAPKTVENFLKLASTGFYNGIKFHRVIKGFMIQGGDPLTKDDSMVARWGTGGPGYSFADEINASSALYQRGYKHGVLAMANSGPNTNGSQFFIMAADYPLPPSYTIFGEVTEGLSVVDAIDAVQTGQADRPVTPVVIKTVDVK